MKTKLRPIGAALLALLTLSACVELEEMQALRSGAEPPASAEPPEPPPQSLVDLTDDMPPIPQRKPELTQLLARQLYSKPARRGRETIATPPQPMVSTVIVDPNALIGLDFEKTANILGPPTRLIEQPPALVWAYDSPNCDMRVFFYPRVGGSGFRALAYKIDEADSAAPRGTAGDDQTRLRYCLNTLIARADGSKYLVSIKREKALSQ